MKLQAGELGVITYNQRQGIGEGICRSFQHSKMFAQYFERTRRVKIGKSSDTLVVKCTKSIPGRRNMKRTRYQENGNGSLLAIVSMRSFRTEVMHVGGGEVRFGIIFTIIRLLRALFMLRTLLRPYGFAWCGRGRDTLAFRAVCFGFNADIVCIKVGLCSKVVQRDTFLAVTATLRGYQWSVLLSQMELQVAVANVIPVCPGLITKMFVDDFFEKNCVQVEETGCYSMLKDESGNF